jgi:hypothetical protein
MSVVAETHLENVGKRNAEAGESGKKDVRQLASC